MKLFKSKKRAAAIGAVAALSIVGGSVAYGYWTTTGTGGSTAATGTSKAFSVSVTKGTPVALAPGLGSQSYTVTVTNPADAGVQFLNSVTARIGATETDAWSQSVGSLECTADDFTVSSVTPTGSDTFGEDLEPGEPWVGTFTVSMDNEQRDQDACKSINNLPLFVKASS